jgi:5-methylcytosine-specific restriction protein B
MPVPDSVTKQHVLEAMDRIGLEPARWPRNSESRDYDVIDPRTGARFPPKLVLSVAAEIATGRPLSRGSFHGGAQTNGRLTGLGFTVLAKSSAKPT